MKLGYDLTIEQTQKLVMTPELIQAIRILQFNTQELETYVQEQLILNPVLEPAKQAEQENLDNESEGNTGTGEIDWPEYIKDREYDDISYRQWEYSKDDREYTLELYSSSGVTLIEHLLFQFQFADVKRGCRNLGKYIIESLDDNGYMTLTKEEIAEKFGAPAEKIDSVLDVIQSFDPPGIGGLDLRECLSIQLKNMNRFDEITQKIINRHLEDIAANRLGHIAKELTLSVPVVQAVSDLIKSLEPKPGRQFASQAAIKYIIPDILLEITDEKDYNITINESSAPRLMVSSYYEKLLAESENDPALAKYLSTRLNSAVWLIKSIEQRKQTIYNVVQAIVKYQKDFFDKGTKYLKTLTLKQIAEEVGIHESTVSRSINGKYMQTPRGVFELKYFFTSGIATGGGESISSKSIKTFIKEIVCGEDRKNPHSDMDMVTILKNRDFNISRRTVAKYRDEMNIPPSSKRKRY